MSKPVVLLGLPLFQLLEPKYFDVTFLRSFFKSFFNRYRVFGARKFLPLFTVKKLLMTLDLEALSLFSIRDINKFDVIDLNPPAIIYLYVISKTNDKMLSTGV